MTTHPSLLEVYRQQLAYSSFYMVLHKKQTHYFFLLRYALRMCVSIKTYLLNYYYDNVSLYSRLH